MVYVSCALTSCAETKKVALILVELCKSLILFRGGQCEQKLTSDHMGLVHSLRSEIIFQLQMLERIAICIITPVFHRCCSDCKLTVEHTRTLLW